MLVTQNKLNNVCTLQPDAQFDFKLIQFILINKMMRWKQKIDFQKKTWSVC